MDRGRIRPIALCLFRHAGRILVGNAYDAVKQEHYCRPLGGGIEFGERGAEAIVREIGEELGAEIVLVFDAAFTDRSFYDQAVLYGHEQGAAAPAFTAEWKSLDELAAGSVRLVPEGLAAFLRSLSA